MATMASEKMVDFTEKKKERDVFPVKKILVHNRPHFDEVLAIVFLKKWGSSRFPGVRDAEIEAWADGEIPTEYNCKNGDELLRSHQILPVGCCGGILDEHGKAFPNCAHLTAEVLGIEKLPELQMILSFCKRVDHDGHSMPFDPHSLMSDMYDFYGDNDDGLQQVLDWAMKFIEPHIEGQRDFLRCQHDFAKTGQIWRGPVNIAAVLSDNSKMNKWIRWKFGKEVDIIVQRRSSGNTIIFTSKKRIDPDDIARLVRMLELKKRRLPYYSWQELEAAGKSEECPWWYYSKMKFAQIMNGSLTVSGVKPSMLSLKEVVGAVSLAGALLFEKCDNDKCKDYSCRKYNLRLLACRRKRALVSSR